MPENSHRFPLLTFNFKVDMDNNSADAYFQEVSGISAELQFDSINAGGNNNYQLKLPTRSKYSNLVLKRGTLKGSSTLLNWCMKTITNEANIDGFSSKFKDITVHLVNDDDDEVFSWEFKDCYPVKWEISNFNAQKSEVAMETIELSYKYFTITK